eukprot:167142_1
MAVLILKLYLWILFIKQSVELNINCGDTVSYYKYEFLDGTNHVISTINFTFSFNETYDEIIFTTCNTETTLATVVYLYDDNFTQINSNSISQLSLDYNPELSKEYQCNYNVPWRILKTSLLLPNTQYYVILQTSFTQFAYQMVQLDVQCNCDCNHMIQPNHLLYSNINIYDNIQIKFNIKSFSPCNSSTICNILHLGSSNLQTLPKLSINGTNDQFIMEFSNNYNNNIFQINKTIDYDNKYHNIILSVNNYQIQFIYDNVTFLNVNSTENIFYHSKYQYAHKLYLSNPWDDPFHGIIDRIYIKSTVSDKYENIDSINYVLVTKPLNWYNAQLFCERQFNASLAVINNDEELNEVMNLRNNINENIKYSDLWISLTDQLNDGDW